MALTDLIKLSFYKNAKGTIIVHRENNRRVSLSGHI